MSNNPARSKADALVQKARGMIDQHEKLFSEYGLPIDVADLVMARDDLPQSTRDRIQQEMTAASDAARSKEFASAREARSEASGRPPKMKPGMGRLV